MARKAKKSIPIPIDWEAPKYQFGQQVKQGQIVAMEYLPSYSEVYKQTGVSWCYWCSSGLERQLKMYAECQIELLKEDEIKTLIESRSEEIEMLRAQLNR